MRRRLGQNLVIGLERPAVLAFRGQLVTAIEQLDELVVGGWKRHELSGMPVRRGSVGWAKPRYKRAFTPVFERAMRGVPTIPERALSSSEGEHKMAEAVDFAPGGYRFI